MSNNEKIINMKNNIIIGLILPIVLLVSGCMAVKTETNSVNDKIESLIAQMTLEEKVGMIHANSSFTTGGVPRLGIPELIMSDGPHGVRHEHGRDWDKDPVTNDYSTYLPVGTSLASTWNPDLGYQFGQVLGAEARFRGKDVILGPGLNIIRDPLNGRNFEYMSEDPYLNSKMVTAYTKGVQENDVAVSAKHYVANSLEYERRKVDVLISERALREIYLPGFKAAVQEGGALTVMAAYNKFRGDWCSQSDYLINDILKDEFGFRGLIMSDWNAVNNTYEALVSGLDIEMGTDLAMMKAQQEVDYNKFWMADAAIKLIRDGVVQESIVDEKVRRILRVMFEIGIFRERKQGAYNTSEHQVTARKIADEAIILLRNEQHILPLKKEIKKLAVIGANANWKHAGAGGSSQVKALYEVTPLKGLKQLVEDSVNISFSQGYEIKRDGGTSAEMIADAVASVKNADAAIYVGGWFHGYSDDWGDNAYDAESVDKPGMVLPFGQDELIKAVLEANPDTVIVLMGGGPVDFRNWDHAKVIVQAGYPGMEGGNALAAILFGDVNPSGKLSYSWPAKLEDSPAHALASYPDEQLIIDHKEDIFVGYRYFDTYDVTPSFAFGHGLSYSQFKYSNLSLSRDGELLQVSVDLTNRSSMPGAEVVQVYVHDIQSTVRKAEKELKGFAKIQLAPGASGKITINLDADAFKYYDENLGWRLEPGEYSILVGSSSDDIRLSARVTR